MNVPGITAGNSDYCQKPGHKPEFGTKPGCEEEYYQTLDLSFAIYYKDRLTQRHQVHIALLLTKLIFFIKITFSFNLIDFD